MSAILSSKRPGRVVEEITRPELTVSAAPGPNRPAQRREALCPSLLCVCFPAAKIGKDSLFFLCGFFFFFLQTIFFFLVTLNMLFEFWAASIKYAF